MNKKRAEAVTFRIALSAIVVALYFVVMFFTQTFSFGAYQIRLATAFYALALPFPFLVLPLALANCLSNILGGMAWDIIGGFLVGLCTAGTIALLSKIKGKSKYFLLALLIEFVPSLMVPLWLSPILGVPYGVLLVGLLVGQLAPAALGAVLMFALDKRLSPFNIRIGAAAKPAHCTKLCKEQDTSTQNKDTQTDILEQPVKNNLPKQEDKQ